MKTEEHKFLWEMRVFAKAHAGKLISGEFLGRTHQIKEIINKLSGAIETDISSAYFERLAEILKTT